MNRLLVFSLLLLSTCSFAQVVEYPLNSNPVIKEYIKVHQFDVQPARPVHLQSGKLLPFLDDFSYDGIYPDPSLWIDSNVFINSTFCDNPVTVGVATFDGIDKKGNPYDSTVSKNVHVPCDTLTSVPIDLSLLTPSDNVFFTFYNQPQGLGLAPDAKDLLVLQFKAPLQDTWKTVWSKPGSTDKPFERVDIAITDTSYLHGGFTFRFYNYASSNANEDHWNIDYVYIDKGRSANDAIKDIGFVNRPKSILKDYESMPWKHYKTNPLSFMKFSYSDSIRNLGFGSTTPTYTSKIFEGTNTIFAKSPGTPNPGSVSGGVNVYIDTLNNFVFPSNVDDTSSFIIKSYIDQIGGTLHFRNDTVDYRQKFYEYYAYDDGSAESNFGIPVNNTKIAYRFDVKVQDTLKGLQIYFNPTGWPVHKQLFSIALFKDISAGSTATNIVTLDINQKPYNIGINGFATYLFDTTLIVSGTTYIGIIQNSDVMLGIGIDKNTDSGNNLLVNFDGTWQAAGIKGSAMIRPFFGYIPAIGIGEIKPEHFSISPNPCTDYFSIQAESPELMASKVDLLSITGQLVTTYDLRLMTKFPVSSLPSGIYFVKISGKNFSQVNKIIVQH